jgi:hypothetical protein
VYKGVAQYFRDVRDPQKRRKLLRTTAAVIGGVGATLGLLATIGATVVGSVIGYREAFALHWRWIPAVPLVAMVGLPIGALLIAGGEFVLRGAVSVFDRKFNERTPKTQSDIVGFVAMVIVSVAGVTGLAAMARSDLQDLYATTAGPDGGTPFNATERAAKSQRVVITKMSGSAKKLIDDLDKTAVQVQSARETIASTLNELTRQQKEADDAAAFTHYLQDKQRAIQLRTDELQRILDGKEPITRADLVASGRSGLIWGFVFGIVTGFFSSLAASWAWRALEKRFRSTASKASDGEAPKN